MIMVMSAALINLYTDQIFQPTMCLLEGMLCLWTREDLKNCTIVVPIFLPQNSPNFAQICVILTATLTRNFQVRSLSISNIGSIGIISLHIVCTSSSLLSKNLLVLQVQKNIPEARHSD
jgi:hypothetical protein